MSPPYMGCTPATPFIHIDAAGQPSLQGSRCSHCNNVVLGRKRVCPQCTARSGIAPIELAQHGTLYTYTVVYRSFPGVNTPFIAATVDLHGGGTLKGVLLDVAPQSPQLQFDMPVRLVFRETGQHDAAGAAYLSYFFVPAQGAAW